jgi:hypothetical protein
MALEKAQKQQVIAVIYTVSSVVLSLIAIFMLYTSYSSIKAQQVEIADLRLEAENTQSDILEITRDIKETRDNAELFIPSNFESFFDSEISNSELTRMFDDLETRYQASGQSFLINSISYGSSNSSEESQTEATSVNLSLTTSQENLLTFLRDIEKTSLSSSEAFYYIDPQSLNFSNITSNTIQEEISVDLQVNILLRK